MHFSLFDKFGARNSGPVFHAFEHSLRAAGHTVTKHQKNADVAVIWSVLWNGTMAQNQPIWQYFRSKNKPVIVLEVGGINRGTTWKVGLNGINRDAYFGDSGNDSSRRDLLGLKIKPWRDSGEHILICGQHEKSLQWENMPRMSKWLMDTIDLIQQHTDRPIVFRPHPRCRLEAIEHQYHNVYRDEPRQILGTYDDFNLSFNKAHAVVSWSSNPGPQAVIAGVPVYTGPSSLAYPVSMQDITLIDHPPKVNRKQWLNDYAHTEYTIEEIANGLPLKKLTKRL